MQLTIKAQLLGLTATSLTFLAAVGATGYWGISRLQKTASEVAATRRAIRYHAEAAAYNKMTREDLTAAVHRTGQNRQDSLNSLALQSQVLSQKVIAARDAVTNLTFKTELNEEFSLMHDYLNANDAFAKSMAQGGAKIPNSDAIFQLNQKLQQKIDYIGDQMEAGANEAELSAMKQGSRAARAIGIMFATSLLMMVPGSFILVRRVQLCLKRLLQMIQDIAEGEGDVTKRLEVARGFRRDELGEVSRLFNLVMDKLQDLLRGLSGEVFRLEAASELLLESSAQITSNSSETAAQSSSVSLATQQVGKNLKNLWAGASEMTVTIENIAANAREAAKLADSAVSATQIASTTISKLGRSSTEIGVVIKLITSITQQTNLLALNAAIEAARAGEAGNGFAMVAKEVKELAMETAKAAENISQQITAIQADTKGAEEAIGTVSGVINRINKASATIAIAVEQQSSTTSEMTRNAIEADKSASDIFINIGGVAHGAEGISSRALESQKAAQDLASIAKQVGKLMRQFKIERGDRRVAISLAVKLIAIGSDGTFLEQEVMTVNVSRLGALLTGVRGKFRIASEVTLSRRGNQAKYLIAWVGGPGTRRAGQIGVTALDPSAALWDDVIIQASLDASESQASGLDAASGKAKAHSAS